MQNFFSYQIKTDALPQGEQVYKLRADAEDREKIREILKIPGVKSFSSDIHLRYNHAEHLLKLWGRSEAELVLESVITLEHFSKKYAADFELSYDTKATLKSQREEEVEITIDDNLPDVVINGTIDLADIAIEQIALVMEDYPRQEGEVFTFQPEFSAGDERPNPFAVLKNIK